MGGWREFGGVNEGRGKTKFQSGLTQPEAEKSFPAQLVSFRRLSSPPKNKIGKKRRHQLIGDPDYISCFHRSFLSSNKMC
jgi:hypothetical protein